MQLAENQQGQLIYAWNAKKDEQYFCPECHMIVKYCHGNHKQHYFAHAGSECKQGGPETNEHLLGKRQMFDWLSANQWNASLEHYLPAVSQRPDIIACRKNRKVVIEFQCSPLSLKRMTERNNGYRQLNLPFYWYLGSPYQVALHRSKQAQFTQLLAGQPALFFWNVRQKCPHYRFLSIQNHSTVNCFKNEYDLGKLFVHYPALNKLVYQQRHLLGCCPLITHRSDASFQLMVNDEFTWRVKLCLKLDQLQLGTRWAYLKWERWFELQTEWLPMPCLSEKTQIFWHRKKINQFLHDLIVAGCLITIHEDLVLAGKPCWFKSVTDKMATIKRLSKNNR